MDTLAGVTHHCQESVTTLPEEVQQQQPCAALHIPLNLRDCDPGLGGQLEPQKCCEVLHEARPTDEKAVNTCFAELCSQENCVKLKLVSIPGPPCISPGLHPKLIHSISPQEGYLEHPQMEFTHANRRFRPRVRIVHVKEGVKDMDFDQVYQSHPEPPYCSEAENEPDPLLNPENKKVDCWDLSDEGPQPGMDCYLTPLWLPTQVSSPPLTLSQQSFPTPLPPPIWPLQQYNTSQPGHAPALHIASSSHVAYLV